MELIELQQMLELELSKPIERINAHIVKDLLELLGCVELPADLASKLSCLEL